MRDFQCRAVLSSARANYKGLQISSQLLRGRGRSFLSENACVVVSEPLSAHLLPKLCAKDFRSCGDRGPVHIFSSPAAASQNPRNQDLQRAGRSLFWWNIMSASSALLGGSELGARGLAKDDARFGQSLSGMMRATVTCSNKGLDNCRRASGILKNREPRGTYMLYKCFWSNAHGLNWKSNASVERESQVFLTSCTAPYSAGAAPDVSCDAILQEELLHNPVVSSEEKNPDDRPLKLLSGSCYLPHPAKEDTGGEDAHFICLNEQAIGVADGVGGWADLGVDAGQYARELMSNSVNAIQEEPKGSIDPLRVLEKAYSITKAKGSSTACIIALTEQGVHALNLGDSGFIVVRDGCTILKSPVQQHDFNFTYQLESGNCSDLPSAAQVFTFPVASGDVIVAGTDGLFDNLYNNEITAVVVHSTRAGFGTQVTAQKIAALARQRAQDKNRQTPFSTAAQDAGYRYYGGKLDDITVVVSYVAASDAK